MKTKTNQIARKTVAQTLISAALLAGLGLSATAQVTVPLHEIQSSTEPSTKPSVLASAEASGTRASDVISDGINAEGKLMMTVNKSQVVTTKLPYKTVNIASPEIADVNRINDYEILLTAKKAGTTQLIVWDVAGLSQNVDVSVVSDLEALQSQLDKIFLNVGIKATNVNGSIALEGRVKSLAIASQAVAVAEPYGKVLNFLEIAGGQQVMLKVKFAEVSRSASSQLGISLYGGDGHSTFGGINGPFNSPLGAMSNGEDFTVNSAVNIFGAGTAGNLAFEYFVQALRRNNLMRILAEPNVIAISGEPASFLAGGEFPIPVPQSGGDGDTITIEYKQFGVKLNFLPTVLGDGKIRLKVEPEVSDLDYSRSVSFKGFTIPGLSKRTLSTTLELSEGQTFAVAGLLNNKVVASKDVTPLLGDIPILGALFRSVRYERSETELVVLVTPELVGPMNPDQVGNLPGDRWSDPTELQLFLDAKVGSVGARGDKSVKKGKKGNQATSEPSETVSGEPDAEGEGEDVADTSEPVRFRGQYGFAPATN